MLRRSWLMIPCVLAACAAPEPEDGPSAAAAEQIESLAPWIGESAEALSQDPCVIGCAGAAVEGCPAVVEACDTSLVVAYAGAWITCTEAVRAACGSTAGLYACAVSCRARDGRE